MKTERKRTLYELDVSGLRRLAREAGEPDFRAKQLSNFLYVHLISDPEKMGNLPKNFRAFVKERFPVSSVKEKESHRSADGTEKLLLELSDGESVEMAVIPSEERMTFCLSTQVGCPVSCRFCASGANGLKRNLSCGEIIDELLAGVRHNENRLPDNIVFMGIGEGLMNFDELSVTLERLTGAEYFNMSPRRITVSTSGFVPGMRRFAALEKEYTLAVSLHAADDETRAQIIPGRVRYPIAEIMAAADEYRLRAGRMVTIEYTLLDSVNDRDSDAAALAELAKRHHAKINLIPMNSVFCEYRRPGKERIRRFFDIVKDAGAHVTLRRERGSDVNGACGQLWAGKRKA